MREHYSEEVDEVEGVRHQLYHFIEVDQYERVLPLAFELLQKDPDDADLYSQIGNAFLQLGKYEEAEKYLKKAVSLDPENTYGFQLLANLEYERSRLGVADEYIRKALQLNPLDVFSWYLLGVICVHFEDFKQTQLCIDKIRTLDPESSLERDLDLLCRSSINNEYAYSTDEKIVEHQNRLSEDPNNAYHHYALGLLYCEEKRDYEKAEEFFRKALQQSPSDKDYQKALIMVFRKKDRLLRLLWLPFLPVIAFTRLYAWGEKKTKYQKFLLFIAFLFIAKYVLVLSIVVLLIFYSCFWPITKLYEYLTLAETHKRLGKLQLYRGWTAQLHKMPLAKKMLLFTLLTLVYWSGVAYVIFDQANGDFFVMLIGVCFSLMVFIGLSILIWEWIRARVRSKKNRKLNQLV